MSLVPAAVPPPRALRHRALLWSLLHAPALLLLFAAPALEASSALQPGHRAALWPTFPVQATLLALVPFLAAAPFSAWPRLYVVVAPAAAGLWTALVALDALVYSTLRMHVNGFVLRVLVQPNALLEIGIPPGQAMLVAAAALAWTALEAAVGARFLRAASRARPTWRWVAAVVALAAAERVYVGGLTFFAGPPALAASTVLPLQAPVRMQSFYRRIFGPRQAVVLQHEPSGPGARARGPAAVAFTRRPDVLFVLAESLPADHFDARTTPRLFARTERGGARFERHYSSGVSTNFGVFSLLYGEHAHRIDSAVGSGRRPLLFEAMRANGYQVRVLSGSCLDWMDLQHLVFAGISPEEMRNHCEKDTWATRDQAVLADARAMVSAAPPDEPLFVFLFLFGTHFNYFHPPGAEVFTPAWDGSAGLKSTTASGPMIQNRARNAAHALDATVDGFLDWFRGARGRGEPLVLFTADHGEEFRQKGHIGHGSALTREQLQVPFAVFGPGVAAGVHGAPTSHVDVAATLFRLLGSRTPPGEYSDGMSAFDAAPDRFVIAGLGWEPRYAAISSDLKVVAYAGSTGMTVTDPDDRQLPGGDALAATRLASIVRALRGEPTPTVSGRQGPAEPAEQRRPASR